MDPQVPSPSGLLGSLRGFADGLLGSVQDRVELLSIELHEEKHRLIQIIVWISAVVLCGVLAVVFASLALVFWFWDTARVEVTGALALTYGGAFLAVLWYFRRYLARQPRPFAGTLSELKNDRTCIQPQS